MDLLRYYKEDGSLVVVTDKDVSNYLQNPKKKADLADFIYKRHYYRYIYPFTYKSDKKIEIKGTEKSVDDFTLLHKNGFSIMANCCLLIETLESFHRGWETSKNNSENAFLKFFSRDKYFVVFAIDNVPTQFYKNIRCGILHQGETTRGWSITRDPQKPLLDKKNKVINASSFLDVLTQSLSDYKDELEKADWSADIWKNARNKIKAIIKNCNK